MPMYTFEMPRGGSGIKLRKGDNAFTLNSSNNV